ncbi:PEP-CTERM protein-sorting domain-containing protein [Massilia sp. PDC64]|nr:hypothetical protein [Massilia sp. PDC64]SDC71517.1 PEP-CTERM protein-sorting domain-containing protein [Massilia sp. PDC64]
MKNTLIGALALAAALALPQAQAAILTGTTGSNTVTDYSGAGLASFDLDLATFTPTTFSFVLEAGDLAGPLAFNALVRNLAGTALDEFSFTLNGIAFSAAGSVTPAFGTVGGVTSGAHTANVVFSAPEWAEFQFGNALAVPGAADWLLDTRGLRAGDTFTITAATATAAEVPEPSSALLAMTALLGMTAAYKRKRG